MKYFENKIEDVIKELNTTNDGLTTNEANRRLNKYGKNKLIESRKESKLKKFLNEFNDLMIIILLLASILSFIISYINHESYIDSIIIIAIVILNALLGFIQEIKADKAIDELKKMQETYVKVKRDNKLVYLNSENLVKGDLIYLEAGDKVPADCRIIWESLLKVDESSLTGESVPVEKSNVILKENTPLASRINMIYTSTNVVYGKCHALVCNTGMDTEFGNIAKSLSTEEKEITPLQSKIDNISKFISLIIAIIIFIVFIIGIIKKINILELIMLSISLAVAAIPEGLPAIITIILSLGMNTMAKKKAIVRKMSSVETLGSTEIICSDKTGTITKNQMTVREYYYNNKLSSSLSLIKQTKLLESIILNNDVELNEDDYVGEPTEVALLKFIGNQNTINKVRKNNPRINELPFDSERKMMSTINKNGDKITLYCKGSFDSVINKCNYIYENNKVVKLTLSKKEALKKIEQTESNKAYRLITFAYKELNNNYKLDYKLENNLIFLGMVAMIDPPRNDVKEAICLCKQAHIKPIMITGDSLSTAKSIAREVGILIDDDEAIEGINLDKMTSEELKNNIPKYTVYARVSPLNKLSIVKAWKENNKIVAMTGDGVNDAPAIKQANIGIGMGVTGTEVSKGVSDLILADDSFSTIVTAVEEGRRIYDNIRNILVYLLAGNIAEVLVVFIGMLLGYEIFTPIQLLYINLITDSLPAISLAFEKSDKNIMNREVRPKESSFFTKFLIAKIITSSLLKTFLILFIFLLNNKLFNYEVASTTAFLTLTLLEISFAYTCKNLKEPLSLTTLINNKYLNKCFILLIIIQIIIFNGPFKNIFGLTTITYKEVLYCIITTLVVFILDETSKTFIRKYFKD